MTPLPVATQDSGAFEIEEVEALPEPRDDETDDEADNQTTEEAAFDDRHEGASDYVRIDPERRLGRPVLI